MLQCIGLDKTMNGEVERIGLM